MSTAAVPEASPISSRLRLRRRRAGVLVTVVMVASLLAGCGGGGDEKAGGATTASTTAPTTSTTAASATSDPADRRDKRLFVLSDSVLLGARHTVPDALPDWKVTFDGKESRFISAAVDDLRAREAELGPVVMAQIGNNYDGDEAAYAAGLDALYDVVGPDRTLILLHVYPIEQNRAEVNAAIDALAAKHDNVKVADWPSVVDADPSIATKDGLHLKPRGTEVMAQFVKQQLAALPPAALVTPPAAGSVSAPSTTATAAPTG